MENFRSKFLNVVGNIILTIVIILIVIFVETPLAVVGIGVGLLTNSYPSWAGWALLKRFPDPIPMTSSPWKNVLAMVRTVRGETRP